MLAQQETIEQASAPSCRYAPGRPTRRGEPARARREPEATAEPCSTVVPHPRWRGFPLGGDPMGRGMGDVLGKIDSDLRLTLGSLEGEDELTVLLVPCDTGPGLRMLLAARRHEGRITYRVLRLVNAIEVTGGKAAILELASWPQITRMRSATGFLHGR
jgi:hypothetical protein